MEIKLKLTKEEEAILRERIKKMSIDLSSTTWKLDNVESLISLFRFGTPVQISVEDWEIDEL